MRKTLICFALIVAVVAAAYCGYARFQQTARLKLCSSAVAFLAKGDLRSASLVARQSLQRDSANPAMYRILAQVAEASESPEAIALWARVVELEKQSFGSLAALATAALRHGETGVAETALSQIKDGDRNTVDFHLLSAAYALEGKQFGVADAHLSEAARLAPANRLIELNLASLRLQSTEQPVVAEARATLNRLRSEERLRPEVLRALHGDARKSSDKTAALALARELASEKRGSFEDQLTFLDELLVSAGPEFAGRLDFVEKLVAGQAGPSAELIHWLNLHEKAEHALAWGDAQPAELVSFLPLQLALAESLTVVRRWDQLTGLLARGNGKWQELEFLRLAIQSRVARELGGNRESKAKWDEAIHATKGKGPNRWILARLVDGWGWKAETEQLWWLIAGQPSGQRAALKALYRRYSDEQNTPQLYRVVKRVYALAPTDPVAKNNYAAFSLLLGKNFAESTQLALENFQKHARDSKIASTYAFALHRQGQTAEGLHVLAAFSSDLLRDPALAAYYGILLAESGRSDEAQPYLEFAAMDKSLVPEERMLIAVARAK